MTEIEKLINRQISDTKHTAKGGRFHPFNCRKIIKIKEEKTDKSGLKILEYPKRSTR